MSPATATPELSGLRAALATRCDDPPHCLALLEQRPHLFSPHVISIPAAMDARLRTIIAAVETVVALPAYRQAVLGGAAPPARHTPGARGVCFGYDFHLVNGEPKLIEINTNAGGWVLNALWGDLRQGDSEGRREAVVAAMFAEEWARERGGQPMGALALVDEAPEGQYLYPEFLLFQGMMGRRGLDVRLADAGDLRYTQGALRLGETPIPMIYNRLTDFMLAQPRHEALRQAWLEGRVLLTPHPQAHALYADKRNLAILSDPQRLRSLGATPAAAECLAGAIPPTLEVHGDNAEALWGERRRWFFKPADGFGGRGAYRGEKLTRRAWGGLLARPHVAQAFAPPDPTAPGGLKMDLRYYVDAGVPRLLVARLYQGQTTNFRTPQGGFAPVCIGA
jgi:hypothetical protein